MEERHPPESFPIDPDWMLTGGGHDLVTDGYQPVEVILADDLKVSLYLILPEFA